MTPGDNFAQDLVIFLKAGKVPPAFRPALDKLGMPDLRHTAISLSSWLHWQHRSRFKTPMQLDWRFPGSHNLKCLLSTVPSMAEVFVIEGDGFNFRADLPQEERARFLQIVYDGYQPPLFT